MRKLIYITIAVLLAFCLYILLIKTTPKITPAWNDQGTVLGKITGQNLTPLGTIGLNPWGYFNLTTDNPQKLLIKTVEDTGAKIEKIDTEDAFLVIGTFPGPLSYDETEKILTKVFQDLQTRKIQKMADDNLISWGGYSPKISNFLQDLAGNPVNLQGAMRYNAIKDATYLYLGSPVIYIEY